MTPLDAKAAGTQTPDRSSTNSNPQGEGKHSVATIAGSGPNVEQRIVEQARVMVQKHLELLRLQTEVLARCGKTIYAPPLAETLRLLEGLPAHILEAIDIESLVAAGLG